MVSISQSEIEDMRGNILDLETGMTELDLFEAQHAYEDWEVF